MSPNGGACPLSKEAGAAKAAAGKTLPWVSEARMAQMMRHREILSRIARMLNHPRAARKQTFSRLFFKKEGLA